MTQTHTQKKTATHFRQEMFGQPFSRLSGIRVTVGFDRTTTDTPLNRWRG